MGDWHALSNDLIQRNPTMNTIVAYYRFLKRVVTFEELVQRLHDEGMPITQNYSQNRPLFKRCLTVGCDWIRFQYVRQGRPKVTVYDVEFDGAVKIAAWTFYSILMAGETKTLFLMTQEASAFIEETALTENLTPEFFRETLAKPLVLYAGEPNCLFGNVSCISLAYHQEDDEIGCVFLTQDAECSSREFGRAFSLSELNGRFLQQTVAMDETGESTLYMIQQGLVSGKDDLDEQMYRVLLYAFKFILLRRCDKQPFVAERQYKERRNANRQKELLGRVNYQRVSLTTTYRTALTRHKDSSRDIMVLDKEGRTLQATRVVGFLRRQHYGPRNSKVKFVYIDAHDSHAWKKDGIRIVRVVK